MKNLETPGKTGRVGRYDTERTALEMGRKNLDSKDGNGCRQSVSHASHRKR